VGSLSGRLLVGAIHSLSVRRDPAAFEILSRRLNDPDPDVASAAAAALGGLPGKQAAERLTKALAEGAAAIRSAVAEACMVQAERMRAAGDAAGAAALLDIEDPTKVIGRLRTPLLSPNGNERSGYVPNVVYSCGGLVHAKLLVIPYAMSDYATTFATVPLQDVLDAMVEHP
jgi:hypothetical protein